MTSTSDPIKKEIYEKRKPMATLVAGPYKPPLEKRSSDDLNRSKMRDAVRRRMRSVNDRTKKK